MQLQVLLYLMISSNVGFHEMEVNTVQVIQTPILSGNCWPWTVRHFDVLK